MKVIEVTHPIQEDQLIKEDVAMAFGFFDGMHRGHHKVFEALDERAAARNLKKAVTTFDPHPSVVLNPERKRTDYLTPLSDKLEMIEQHDVDYCIVINFSSRFASVTAEEFVQDYIINNHVQEVVAGFDFTYGKFGKGNMSVLNEMNEFSTTIVGKQEMETEKISTTAIREALKEGNLKKFVKIVLKKADTKNYIEDEAQVKSYLEQYGITAKDLDSYYDEIVNQKVLKDWCSIYDSKFSPSNYGDVKIETQWENW